MIIELPQAEKCCWTVSLRFGVIIIIIFRIVLLLLVILLGVNIISFRDGSSSEPREPVPKEWKWCYDLETQRAADLVLLTITVVLLVLWLLFMIPAVIWEYLLIILLGALMELVVWVWYFFISSYQLTLAIFRKNTELLLLYSIVCLLLECYVLWIVWSYYVEVKEYIRRGSRVSAEDTTDTSVSGLDSNK